MSRSPKGFLLFPALNHFVAHSTVSLFSSYAASLTHPREMGESLPDERVRF
jgi:hypothetical protein